MKRRIIGECQELIEKYPKLYKELKYISAYTGWYDIIDRLSAALEPSCNEDTFCKVAKEEKGMLVFKMSRYTPHIVTEIDSAEVESVMTCQYCGDAGTLIHENWIQTCCLDCQKEYENA